MTARAKAGTCLKIVGFNPMRDRSLRDARQAHQPAALAHDRRHDGAPIQGEGAERLRPARRGSLRGLSRLVRRTRPRARIFCRYQLHLAKQQISPGSINAAIAALRFFFTVTCSNGSPDLVRPLTMTVNKPRKAPGRAERGGSGASPRSRAGPQVQVPRSASPTAAQSLRVSEVAHLKVSDIEQPAHDAAGRAGQEGSGTAT